METIPNPPPASPPPRLDPYAPPSMPGTAYAKADLGKRFVAVLIDSIIAWVPYAVFGMFGIRGGGLGMLVGAAYILLRDGLAFDFADGRSIGKKLMKLRPLRLDGGPMTMEVSARRNWTLAAGNAFMGAAYLILGWGALFATPIAMLGGLLGLAEAILVLVDNNGRRIGDKTGNTQVITVAE